MQPPILITGCARSRTSLVAGIIERAGAWGGTTCGATPANKRGQYENTDIRNNLVKPFLRGIGCDPMGQDPLPDEYDLSQITEVQGAKFRDDVLNVLRSQPGYWPNSSWYYKGAKICLLWPLWDYAFPQAKHIIVRRHTEDIVTSCMRTHFMRAYVDRSGWRSWVNEHLKRFEEMKAAGLNVFELWSDKIIDGDYTEIKEAVQWCGLHITDEQIKDFVDPSMTIRSENNGPRNRIGS